MHILLADDDALTTLRLERFLQGLGHTITTTANGLEAWEWIQRNRPHVVLSDWVMPGLDGPELCRRIRSLPADRYIYILLLTGRDSREDRVEGLRAGADDFLTKPPDSGELAARLDIAWRILTMQQELKVQAERLRELSEALSLQNARLVELVATDSLTGLHNRRHFQEALAVLVHQAERNGRALSLAMIDVDQFKAYNDSYGHPEGDEALRGVADALRLNVRSHDQVARYGGEEFVVALADTGKECALAVAERLRRAVAERSWRLRPITISIGTATWRPGVSAFELVDRADRALYEAKRRGRDRVFHFDALAEPPTLTLAQAG